MQSSQKNLVQKLVTKGIISSRQVIDALMAIDRGLFVSSSSAYDDKPRQIGYKATISAPHMHGYALEYLKEHLFPGANALDIGSGSGYLTACMAHMMNYQGKVVGVEHIPQLVEKSIESINLCAPEALRSGNIVIVEADGRLGCSAFAPYSAIHVGAVVEEIPSRLIEQLSPGGRMVVPVGKESGKQRIVLLDKDLQGNVKLTEQFSVVFIPLCDKNYQIG